MYRIYREGNYIFIDNETTGVRAEGLAKDVLVRVGTTTSEDFSFTNINGFTSSSVNISNLKDKDGNVYTLQEFRDFYTTQTGAGTIDIINGTI